MKGAYPEEAVAHGVFSSSSVNFRIWKWIERRLIVDAKRVIVVSVPFYEHVRGLAVSKNVSVIPCCVDLNRVKYDEEMRRTVRKRFGLEESFVLLYSGSLGPVYDSSLIAEYFAHFKSFIDTAFLLILTNRESSAVAESHLRERGIATDDYLILNPQPDEIAHLTLIGSAGLLFLKPFDFNKIALSIKFGEYLASGLPVIVNSHAGGAADLVAKHRCGIVVNSVNCRDFGQEEWLLQNYDRIKDRGFDLVEKHLSVQTCVRKYLSAYGKQASQMSTLE